MRREALDYNAPMRSSVVALLMALALAAPSQAPGATKDTKETKDAKAKKPRLDLRGTPRFSFSPATILFTAELVGGDDVEEYYCPELEWDWDDGGKSVKEGDCPPFEPGVTKIERRFTAEHTFAMAGAYSVRLTLRRVGRDISKQTVTITVRPGLGDQSQVP
jgi:hypothetical protein